MAARLDFSKVTAMREAEDGESRFTLLRPTVMQALVWWLGLALIVGSLAAPWSFWAVQWIYGTGLESPGLSTVPFHRYVHRSIIGAGLILVWLLRRPLRIETWSSIGLSRDGKGWSRLAAGFGLGSVSMALVALFALGFGARELRPHAEGLVISKMVGAATAAIAVALLEEILFRGMLLGTLRRAGLERSALVISSLGYAWLHFLGRPDSPAPIVWHSGWVTLGEMAGGLVVWSDLNPGLPALFLAGMTLGWGFLRTGSLYLSIGLHAGWVFWSKLYGATTRGMGGGDEWFWGRGKMYDGWLCLLVLGLLYGGCLLWERRIRHENRTP